MNADRTEGRPVRLATLAMTGLSTSIVALAIADVDRRPAATLALAAATQLAPLGLAAWFLGRRGRLGAAELAGLLSLFALPAALQGAAAAGLATRQPLEVVLLAMLRNLGLGLAALSFRRSCARLAALVSLFLALVGSATGDAAALPALMALHAVAGTLWLMLAYWEALHPSRAAGGPGPRRLPASALAWVAAVVGVLAGASALGPTRAATLLAGLVPSSGGTGEDDPDARSGVNDGANEVAASEDPRSVGFTDTEIYLETDKSSLYDAFNDMYGEPFVRKKQERMFAISSQDVREQKERPAENLQAGREFPLVRQKRNRPSRPADRPTKALAYVKGPTPLHLRLAAHREFDGRDWAEDGPSILSFDATREGPGAWIGLRPPESSAFAEPVAHQVRIGTLDSGPIPTPAHVERFKVGAVSDPDFFGWSHEGIIRIRDRTLPASTVVDFRSRTVDPARLRSGGMPRASHPIPSAYRLGPEAAALVESWVAGVPEGWAQVEAIVDRLRSEYTLDREARVAPGEADPVGAFLLRDRRGPDYLFASAATLALRHLGYTSRMVTGLYASPGKFDLRSRQTPVEADDVHAWAEVLAPGRAWMVVEPTPGYAVLGPEPTWPERLGAAAMAAARWARRHAASLALAALGLGLTLARRRDLLDLGATLAWRVGSRARPGRRVLLTLRLVERRSRWAGRPRPAGLTPARWYGALAAGAGHDLAADLGRLLGLADLLLYAPDAARAAATDPETSEACRRAAAAWTLRRLRTLAPPETPTLRGADG